MIYLLESLSIGSDYSPESLEEQSRNLAANQKIIDKYAKQILAQQVESPRFDNTYCSQCGSEFGPGDHGYSHCDDHVEEQDNE